MPVEPSYVIETSPGNTQQVILFDRPLRPEEVKPLAIGMKSAASCDHGTADISHVWRIPGTLNWPTKNKLARGRSAEPCSVLMKEEYQGLVYSATSLMEALGAYVKSEAHTTRAEFKSRVDTELLWDRVRDIGRAHLMSDGQPDRSAHLARIVEQLHFEKFSLDETISLCLDRSGQWAEKYDNDERMIADIERIWRKFPAQKDGVAEEDKAAAEAFVDAQIVSPHIRSPILKPPSFDSKPFQLLRPGGLITDVASFVHGTSPSPIPEFAITSALALHAGIFGRRYLTPEGLGLNLYIANVAGSGFGKDRPLKAIGRLAEAMGMSHIVGPNDLASDSAVEAILRFYPCQVFPLDELGIFLSASKKNSDSFLRARRKAFLELYSSSTSSWVAKMRASDMANGQTPKSKIIWPTVSFLGATTPTTFYDGLEEDAFSSGFIARLIVTAVDQPPTRQRIRGYPAVPAALLKKLLDAAGGSFSGKINPDPYKIPVHHTAQWADRDAELRMDQIRDWALQVALADERRG
ncbi:DNA-primase RepB domain-containing protein [Bradyrhizobium sp. 142]|uniref:DNA-primase RepB domain-containing protein n=1 Tax=Bradyrhizobium sp. 142 TaxID=2782618 RepID=UPI001FF978A2|nr:DNA-primase RepB domain-containing protein [Bradyrhizobium sp. 142]MCK1728260.1 hypothetical protein [Bradyrhizobium sp. 142]